MYVDIPSLIIVGIFPLIFLSVLLGFKKIISAFSIPSKKEANKEELLAGLHFFKIYGRTIWIAGFISVLIAVIAIMASLEDKMALGPNLALALISLLYCGVLNIVIIIPFTVLIKKQLKIFTE
jgi:flagellar motor component MotA